MAEEIYGVLRADRSQHGGDERLILASLPRGKVGQIVYHADAAMAQSILALVDERAELTRQSPVRLAASLMQNRVGYRYTHAMHAVVRNAPTVFNLNRSTYRTRYDALTEAEIGLYDADHFTVIPVVDEGQLVVMAGCPSVSEASALRQLERTKEQIRASFLKHNKDALKQLAALNEAYPNSPLVDNVDTESMVEPQEGQGGQLRRHVQRLGKAVDWVIRIVTICGLG